jgi:hypothetical protein
MYPAKTLSCARFYRIGRLHATELFHKLILAAGGRCDMCHEEHTRLLVHLYPSGEVRGVICSRCYRLVALAPKSTTHVWAVEYLTRNAVPRVAILLTEILGKPRTTP